MRLRKYGTECPKDDAAKLLRHGVVLLAALLLVCTLMAGAVSADTVAIVSNDTSETTWSYDTLCDAVNASVAFSRENNSKHYTVTLQSDFSGGGIFIGDLGKKSEYANITLDLNGKNYTVTQDPVVSPNYENQAFHLERNNTILIKNGILDCNPSDTQRIYMIIQNYCNLTLDHVTLDGAALNTTKKEKEKEVTKTPYTSSNNNGNVVYKNGTKIIAHEKGLAFDVCLYTSYPSVSVTIADSNVDIQGPIELSYSSSRKEEFAEKATLLIPTNYQSKLTEIWTPAGKGSDSYKWETSGSMQKLACIPLAKIDSTTYYNLADAFSSVSDSSAATITLTRNAMGGGWATVADKHKDITLDLSSYTYTIGNPTVGSKGTETNGFQLKKGNNITIKNGKITSSVAKILIQNYCNLTLENVELDGGNLNTVNNPTPYTSSNNFGNVVYKGSTKIIAHPNGVAFDVCYWPNTNDYKSGLSVTVADSSVIIDGKVECGIYAGPNTQPTEEQKKAYTEKVSFVIPQNLLPDLDTTQLSPNQYCWETYGTDQKILIPCEPVVPKPPVAEPTKNDNGSVTITPAGTDTITVDTTAKTATTKNESSGITITIVFDDIASSGTDSVTGNVSKVDVGYNETPAAAPPSSSAPDVPVPGTVSVTLNLTLNNVTTKLPQINTTFNATVADKVKTENPGFHPVAMITAETNVAEINANITTSGDGGIKIVFTVPKAWVDSMGGPNGGRIWSFHADADGVALRQISSGNIHLNSAFYEIIVYGTSFSSHGIVGKAASAPATQPRQSVYSSGDGNMNNAFRVLFDTKGGSFISLSTGLSYGDTISQPPAPTRDGYTFGGWYKDSACTQGWSFSEGIPGDMTLYAKWTATAGGQTTTTTPAATAQQTTKTTPAATQSQTAAATTAAPVTTTAAGVSPSLTQAPAPVFGMVLGLIAAGVLLRRKN